MNVLIAVDKFKGSLSAKQATEAIVKGIHAVDQSIQIVKLPLADGGDGALEILQDYLPCKEIKVDTFDPLGREIKARFMLTENEEAYIEVASASGLVLLDQSEQNPNETSTYGTGLQIKEAIRLGAKKIFLFLGGSATNEAGIGIAKALGYQFFDKEGVELDPIGKNLVRISSIKKTNLTFIQDCEITLICDVENAFYGTNGAAHVYSPQKGAKAKDIELLDQGLKNFAKILKMAFSKDIANLKGSGAAGGIAGGLYGLLDAKIEKGIDWFLRLTNFSAQLEQTDLVITGEGSLDEQSLNGKVISGVIKEAKNKGKKVVVFAGGNKLNHFQMQKHSISGITTIKSLAKNHDDAISNASHYLERIAKSFFDKTPK